MSRQRTVVVVSEDPGYVQKIGRLLQAKKISVCTPVSMSDKKPACILLNASSIRRSIRTEIEAYRETDPDIPCVVSIDGEDETVEAEARESGISYFHQEAAGDDDLTAAICVIVDRSSPRRSVVDRPQRPGRILVVDDDMDFAIVVRHILQKEGYEVIWASNKAEGLKLAEEHMPDLIILDIMMEKQTDGVAMCYQLKHHGRLKNTPVIIVSGLTSAFGIDLRAQGWAIDADCFMDKPIQQDRLLRETKRLLRECGSRDARTREDRSQG